MNNQPIPFLDLVTLHRELEKDLVDVFREAIHTARFIGGPQLDEFESEFADFCGTKHCVGVGSGTDALRFALLAAGIGPGQTVITVSHTFIATVEAISQAGATTEFVDIDERTFNMDPEKLREYLEEHCDWDSGVKQLTSRRSGEPVTAVVPVHLYGQIADMDPILELANRFKLIVIEDSAQGHGAEYRSRKQDRWCRAGSMGTLAAFSFYPGKNLGACGEAGAITTDDPNLAQKIRMIRDHGQAKKYYHDLEGYNGRLDSIQAGILRVKLRHLPEWNRQRQAAACRYNELFSGDSRFEIRDSKLDSTSSESGGRRPQATSRSQFGIPYEPEWSRAVYHLYVIRAKKRDALMEYLKEKEIYTALHYPVPVHLQQAYADLGYKESDFPVTEAVCKEIVSLPMFPGLTEEQQERVVEEIGAFFKTR